MNEPYCPEPGYYGTDLSRMNFGEMRRIGGSPLAAVFLYLRRDSLRVSLNAVWVPQLWQDIVVGPELLSETCHERFAAPVAELETRGFRVAAHTGVRDHVFALMLDNGGVRLLHESGDFVASVLWTRMRAAEPRTGEFETRVVAIQTACRSGRAMSVTDFLAFLDPPPPRQVVCLPGASVATLWERAQTERGRLDAQGERALPVGTLDELAFLHDAHLLADWQDRIERRKVMVRLTDDQVAEALRQREA